MGAFAKRSLTALAASLLLAVACERAPGANGPNEKAEAKKAAKPAKAQRVAAKDSGAQGPDAAKGPEAEPIRREEPGEGRAGGSSTQPTDKPPSDEEITGTAEEWFTKIQKGGWTIVGLLVLSIIGGAFVLERLFMLRRSRIVPKGLTEAADTLWRKGDYDGILTLCDERPSTLGRVLAFVVRHRRSSAADVSTAAGDIASRELRRHLLWAYPLAVVATLSPLLGLLGTVIGMIEAFDVVVVVGMGDAKAMAGGISKALITTMMGLTIAIPALFAYHFFKSRTNFFGLSLEEEVTELISEHLMRKGTTDAG